MLTLLLCCPPSSPLAETKVLKLGLGLFKFKLRIRILFSFLLLWEGERSRLKVGTSLDTTNTGFYIFSISMGSSASYSKLFERFIYESSIIAELKLLF